MSSNRKKKTSFHILTNWIGKEITIDMIFLNRFFIIAYKEITTFCHEYNYSQVYSRSFGNKDWWSLKYVSTIDI